MGNTHVSTLRGVATVAFMCGSMIHHQMFPDDPTDYVVPSDPTVSGPQRHLSGPDPMAFVRRLADATPCEPMGTEYNDPAALANQAREDNAIVGAIGKNERKMFITYKNQSGGKVTAKIIRLRTDDEGVDFDAAFEVLSGRRAFEFTWKKEQPLQMTKERGLPLTAEQMRFWEPNDSPEVRYFFESKGVANECLRSDAAVDPFATPPTSPEGTVNMEDGTPSGQDIPEDASQHSDDSGTGVGDAHGGAQYDAHTDEIDERLPLIKHRHRGGS